MGSGPMPQVDSEVRYLPDVDQFLYMNAPPHPPSTVALINASSPELTPYASAAYPGQFLAVDYIPSKKLVWAPCETCRALFVAHTGLRTWLPRWRFLFVVGGGRGRWQPAAVLPPEQDLHQRRRRAPAEWMSLATVFEAYPRAPLHRSEDDVGQPGVLSTVMGVSR